MFNFSKFNRFSPTAYFLITVILIFCLHLLYIPNGYTWLDHGNIELGRTILPLSSWPSIFLNRYGNTDTYRPLVTLINSIDYSTYGNSALGFHFTNLLLHIGVVIATPFFLSVFFELTFVELLLSMLIVGIAPAQWLTVGNLSFRSEIMYTLFTMLAIYWHSKKNSSSAITKNLKDTLLFFLFVMYALFSNESAIFVLPLLLVFQELIQHQGNEDKKIVETIKWKGFVVIALCYGIYGFFRTLAFIKYVSTKNPTFMMSEELGIRIVVLMKNAVQTISPFLVHATDSIYRYQIYDSLPIMIVIGIVAVTIYIVRYGAFHIWSKVFILVGISMLPVILTTERLASPIHGYFTIVILPMIFILGGRYSKKLAKNSQQKSILKKLSPCINIIIIVWIGIAAISTFWGGLRLKNDLVLFQPEIKNDDNFLEAHHYIGDYYFFERGNLKEKNRLELAEKQYMRALKIDTKMHAYNDRITTLNNLAGVKAEQNKLNEADVILASVQNMQGNGGSLGIRYNRAIIAYKQKKYQKVVDLLLNSYKEWRRPEPIILLTESLKKLGKGERAEKIMKEMNLSGNHK